MGRAMLVTRWGDLQLLSAIASSKLWVVEPTVLTTVLAAVRATRSSQGRCICEEAGRTFGLDVHMHLVLERVRDAVSRERHLGAARRQRGPLVSFLVVLGQAHPGRNNERERGTAQRGAAYLLLRTMRRVLPSVWSSSRITNVVLNSVESGVCSALKGSALQHQRYTGSALSHPRMC